MIILAHGGSGSDMEKHGEAVQKSVDAGLKAMERGSCALDVVEAVTVVLEDDPLFNAGTGSYMTIDGRYEMDASLMDDRGRVGAVANVTGIRNPVKLARKVVDTPHILMAGRGAEELARRLGFPEYVPSTEKAEKRLADVKEAIRKGDLPSWASPTWEPFLDKARGLLDLWGSDTVGCVVIDGEGNMAAASSTGGTSYKLPGRVGDSPIVGAGFYAGPAGAVTATGIGEEIMKRVVSWEVYRRMADGMHPADACKEVVSYAKGNPGAEMGVIAVSKEGWGEACTRTMAYGVYEKK